MPSALLHSADRVRRVLSARRRLLAAGFAAAAVAAGLHAVAPPSPATTDVVVAATDLPAGVPLRADQVDTTAMPEQLVPRGALTAVGAAAGRMPAGPVRAGEPLTDVRLVGEALVAGYGAGRVAAPVRIADEAAVALLRTGDLVDVLAADPQGDSGTAVVAAGAPVVVVPGPGESAGQGSGGALVVLAVSRETARKLSRAALVGPLSVSLLG